MFPDFDHAAVLPETGISPGPYAAAQRSWPLGRAHFRRTRVRTELPLAVSFPADTPPLSGVRLQVRYVSRAKPDTVFATFQPQPDGSWRGTLRLPYPGVYKLTLQYVHDQKWHFEPAPAGWLLADPSWLDQLAIYTYVPTVNGSFRDWKDDLHRIRDLGFNTIQLLPVTAMAASESPYAARCLFDVDAAYLTPGDPRRGIEQFAEWVDQVAASGLRICLDLVVNHVGLDSEIVQLRPHWIEEDLAETDGFRRAGWHDGETWHKWVDVVRLNYNQADAEEQAELIDYMTDYACFWAQFADRTNGLLRLDNLHGSDAAFMRHCLGAVRDLYPDLAILGELFGMAERTEDLVLDYGLNLMLATPWEHKFAPQLRGYLDGLHRCAHRLRSHTPVNSHDCGSPAEEFGDNRAIPSRLVASALLAPGPWGAVQGIEFGEERKLSFIGRKPRTVPSEIAPYSRIIRQLNQLRQTHPAFCRADNLQFIDKQHPAILAALRFHPRSRQPLFLIALNMDIYHEQEIVLELGDYGINPNGECIELLRESATILHQGRLHLDLAPGESCAFRLPPPLKGDE